MKQDHYWSNWKDSNTKTWYLWKCTAFIESTSLAVYLNSSLWSVLRLFVVLVLKLKCFWFVLMYQSTAFLSVSKDQLFPSYVMHKHHCWISPLSFQAKSGGQVSLPLRSGVSWTSTRGRRAIGQCSFSDHHKANSLGHFRPSLNFQYFQEWGVQKINKKTCWFQSKSHERLSHIIISRYPMFYNKYPNNNLFNWSSQYRQCWRGPNNNNWNKTLEE